MTHPHHMIAPHLGARLGPCGQRVRVTRRYTSLHAMPAVERFEGRVLAVGDDVVVVVRFGWFRGRIEWVRPNHLEVIR